MAESYSLEAILKANVSGFVNGFKQAKSEVEGFVKKNKETFESFQKVGTAATVGGAAIAAGLGATVKVASDFQSSFAGVRKTVDASEAEFKVLEQGIRDMAKELPASANEIAGVAEAAGQLGIKKENILEFSRTMIDLGEATNLTADEAATSFAQFANVVGMPQENFDRLGSSVVALGNSMATTEADIVNMAMRLSGTGAQVGLAEAEIMALAASMSSVGINAEAGGSAMSTVMKRIQNAVADGGKDLAGFAEASGMTSQQFAEAWKNDPITAIDSFIKGLAESGAEGENLNEILGDLGIKGIQETDTLLRLAGASDLLGEAVKTSTGAWDENRALADEAAQRYETFESKLGMLKNTVTDVAISIGNVLLPAVTDFVDFLRGMVDGFSQLDEKTMTIIAVVATLAAGFLLLIGPILMLVGFIPSMLAGFTALSTVFAAVTGPIGLAVAAVIGIGAALVIAYTQFEWFREIVGTVWEGIKSVIMSAVDGIVAFVQDIAAQIATYWNENGEQIKAATQNVWNAIKAVIEAVMPVIKGIISAVWFAIQVVVTTIWNNIKGVIQGALDIILGLVKVFAGLFTGDWQTMWDGVKQLFSGAIEFLWNAVQLMLWGKLLKGATAFAGTFKGTITSLWNTIKSIFTNSINAVKNFFTNGFNAIQRIGGTTMSSLKSAVSTAWNAIKTTFSTVVNSVKNTVSTGFSNVVTAIRTKMSDAVNAVKTKMSDMLKKVTGAAKDFVTAGKDLIKGLIKGIKEMTAAAVGAITGVVDSVVNKAKSLLGIKSPSRVFKQIGEYTGEGFADGISQMQNDVEKAAAGLANSAMIDPPINNIADRLNAVNRSASSRIQTDFTNQLNVHKQPAIINVHVGSHQIAQEIVDDISRLQSDDFSIRRATYGY